MIWIVEVTMYSVWGEREAGVIQTHHRVSISGILERDGATTARAKHGQKVHQSAGMRPHRDWN